MKAVLKLECIGDNYIQRARLIERGRAKMPCHVQQFVPIIKYGQKRFSAWVARLKSGKRKFISGVRDYTFANSNGSRGIFKYFVLDDGIYEVNEPLELGKARRYFVQVSNTEITEVTKEQVLCLTNDI